MPRNGAGVYNLPTSTWYPAVNGVTATSADYNTQMADMQAALTQSVSQDGQTPFTGNLPMGNNKITGLAKGSALTDAAAISQLGNYSGFISYAVSTALTVADVGRLVNVGATSLTMTLPQGSTVRVGDCITFSTTVAFTIARAGTDTINGPTGTGLTSVPMYGICSAVWTGTLWQIVIGSDQSTLASPGKLQFPGGVLWQFGSSVTLLSGTVANISFPTPFSTTAYSVVVCNGDMTITTVAPGVNSFNNVGFIVQYPTVGNINVRTNWYAVGKA